MRVDSIWRGGNVLTLDPARPRATALAVLGDRIVAVGDDADLEGLTADRTVELGGATVVPGFHDAHDHCVFFGMSLAELPLSTPPVPGPAPSTRLPTPAGSPASARVSISSTAVDGVSSLGLSTKVQPAASAGATFHDVCSSG